MQLFRPPSPFHLLRALCLPALLAVTAAAAPPDPEELSLEPEQLRPPPLQLRGEANPDYARELEARLPALPAGDRPRFFRLLRRQQRSLDQFLEELEYNYRRADALRGSLAGQSPDLAARSAGLMAAQRRTILQYRAMARAYQMAGLAPADVNVAELHDCFTVMAAIGTEVLGKAGPGRGAAYWVDGKAAPGGECGINTSGGLIAKGHPIGATGIAMVGWAAWQLLGKVPPALQVPNARAAATFNIGGPICASVCTVLKPAS